MVPVGRSPSLTCGRIAQASAASSSLITVLRCRRADRSTAAVAIQIEQLFPAGEKGSPTLCSSTEPNFAPPTEFSHQRSASARPARSRSTSYCAYSPNCCRSAARDGATPDLGRVERAQFRQDRPHRRRVARREWCRCRDNVCLSASNRVTRTTSWTPRSSCWAPGRGSRPRRPPRPPRLPRGPTTCTPSMIVVRNNS